MMDKTERVGERYLEEESRERSFLFESAILLLLDFFVAHRQKSVTHAKHKQTNKEKKKMEVEEEHEVLRAVRRNAERLSSSSSNNNDEDNNCLLYTSPSPRDQRGSRMPSSA